MYKNVQIWTKLTNAIQDGDRPQIQLLLEELGGVNAISDIGETPLNIAAGESKLDIMQYLLDLGANINGRCVEGYNAILNAALSPQAALQSNFEAIDFLLEKGADLDAISLHQTTSLYALMQMKMFRPAEYLVKRGARLDVTSVRGIDLLSLECPESLRKLMNERVGTVN